MNETPEQQADRRAIREAWGNYGIGLAMLRAAHQNILEAIAIVEGDGGRGLATFKHYRDQILETHRILAGEWERRYGSITKEIHNG